MSTVCGQDAIVAGKTEGVNCRQHDTQSLLPCVVRLNCVVRRMTRPAYLQSIVVAVQIIGCEVQVAVALQWPEKICIVISGIAGAEHGTEGNHVDVAAGTAVGILQSSYLLDATTHNQ